MPLQRDAILSEGDILCSDFHPVMFESNDAPGIKQAALQVNGATGPSGADAKTWKRFISSFGAASDDLCNALACMTRKVTTAHVDPKGLSAYTACRPLTLEKKPGV